MTRFPYDQAAKLLLRGALDRVGRVEAQHELSSDPRWIDVWFEPDPHGRAPPGLLGRMAASAGAFELFHAPLRLREAIRCLGKLMALEPRARLPPMWLVAARRPAKVLTQLGMAQLPDWPRGVYRMTAQALPLHVIVVSELPKERGTLLLRLMGEGGVLRAAFEELLELPPHSWERGAAVECIHVLRSFADEAAFWPESNEKTIVMSASQIYEQIKDEGRREGRKEGRKEGREALLLRQLVRRFGELSEEVVARIRAASSEELDRWGERLLSATSLSEVFDDDE